MPLKRETRGGKRAGAGRKPFLISEKEVKKLIAAAREMEKRTGLSPQAYLMREIDKPTKDDGRLRLAALKIYFDKTTVKTSHGVKEVVNHPAPVLLPIQDGDPAHPEVDVERLH